MTVTDDAWVAARSSSWRLNHRDRQRVAVVASLVVAVLVVLGLAPISGLTQNHVRVYVTKFAFDVAQHRYTVRLVLQNNGWFDQHVESLAVLGPGQRIVKLAPATVIVGSGSRRTVEVTMQVERCRGQLDPSLRLQLRFARPWGSLTDREDGPSVAELPDGSAGTPAFSSDAGETLFMNGPAVQACGD